MGFKIQLANGRYYANKKGRVQYFETLAGANAKIRRRHLKGAKAVHVTKRNRIANKKTRRGVNRVVRRGRKARKGGRKKKVGRPKKSQKHGRKGTKGKVGKGRRIRRRKASAWRHTSGGFEGFF